MSDLGARLDAVRGRLDTAARRAGREPSSIRLIAVSKNQPRERVLEAHGLGLRHFGENRVQEAEDKLEARPPDLSLHMIGHLQSNKAARAARLFDAIDSLDSPARAELIDRHAGELGRRLRVLIQVSLASEAAKHGVEEARLAELVQAARRCAWLDLEGLMILPPWRENPGELRPYFARLRKLGELHGLKTLSMGMSHDFEIAVEEGATEVRIGEALFGPRARP